MPGERWLYPGCLLAPDSGINYELRYLGSVPIRVSIKSVDLETRTRIAHAAIHRVIEGVGLRPPNLSYVDNSINSYLAATSDKNWTAVGVCLTITSNGLIVKSIETKRVIFRHDLSTVSFASGGDPSASEFVCYVAKSPKFERMCYVFECPLGQAQDVIVTLGQAFQLGFQEFKRTRTFDSSSVTPPKVASAVTVPMNFSQPTPTQRLPPAPSGHSTSKPHPCLPLPFDQNTPSSDDLSPLLSFEKVADFTESTWLLSESDHPSSYASSKVDSAASFQPTVPNDEGSAAVPEHFGVDKNVCTYQEATPQKVEQFRRLEPVGEPWYVGPMSRSEAERLLRYEGDFLVRASQHDLGQFILSGLQENKCRHLLLADPNGQVRTRERVFDSIQHLIDHHVQNGLPIRSAGSEIRLIFPVSANSLYEV